MDDRQLLRDPAIEPTSERIAEGLGAANAAYAIFVEGLKSHDIQLQWRYYNDGKAWLAKGLYKWTTKRGTEKEVTTFWLSIWDGFFKVSVFIPEKARADALKLAVDDEAKHMIESAKQIGKLKFFPVVFDVRTEKLLDAIYTLAEFRKTIK